MKKRIYVAGAFNAGNVLDVLANMRRGMRQAVEVLLAGYSPFCPWLDYHFALMLKEGENLTIENFYNYSMAWLEVSDAILVILEGAEESVGTQGEIKKAKELGIPICYSLGELNELFSWP